MAIMMVRLFLYDIDILSLNTIACYTFHSKVYYDHDPFICLQVEEDVKAIARLFADMGDSYVELIATGTCTLL